MNGVKLQGKILKVIAANEGLKASRLGEYIPSTELEAEERGKLIDKHESRQELMQKLAGDEKLPTFPVYESLITSEPSHCIYLANLFDLSLVDLEKEPTYFLEVREDVLAECSDCGEVEDIFVDQTSNGDVWVKFANKNVNAAKKAIEKLNGRLFGGQRVTANFTTESVYNEKTGTVTK
eukprot:TRINITY_DN1530_c0_g2_i4.p1 TRINITY_DN1530_c0_g2~~TRINITY_DN1530_c0_g2_i4.p1  ORF type:complete len:179 (+),score=53.43 TRINITY_DN1530_c0_g2_i4:1839-2375(+)